MPDGLGQLAGDVDPGNLGATLATEAFLVPLVAIAVARIAGGVGGSFDERPAQVLSGRSWPRSAEVVVARLADERDTTRCIQ